MMAFLPRGAYITVTGTEIPGLEDEKSVDLDNRLKQIKIEARGSSYLGGVGEDAFSVVWLF